MVFLTESGITLPPSAIWSCTPDIAVLGVKKRVQGKSVEKARTLNLDHGICIFKTITSFVFCNLLVFIFLKYIFYLLMDFNSISHVSV